MVARRHAGTRMSLLQQRCTDNLLHVLTAGTLALMLYALLYEAGNLVNLPNKRIGFYNFCLWNDSAGELQCLDNKRLQAIGISLPAMALATVCVYTCLVIIIFHLLFVLMMNCTGQREGWKMILIVSLIKVTILSGGLLMFLSQTSLRICICDLTGGFWALLGTQALLLLQIRIVTVYLRRAKDTHMCQSPFPEEALPTKI